MSAQLCSKKLIDFTDNLPLHCSCCKFYPFLSYNILTIVVLYIKNYSFGRGGFRQDK